MKRIPHSRPTLGRNEKKAVARVVDSGMLAQGVEVLALEDEMAGMLQRRHAVAVSSGTAALHLALAALGVGPGDRVAMPSYACTALLHAVSLSGAAPLLTDVDPSTFNLDPDDLGRRLTRRVKAVIVPHMFGLPAEIDAIAKWGLPVIEDCAIALGARWRGKPVGNYGTLAVASFYATKMMTTGEGGMVLGDRSRLLETVRDLRSYDHRKTHRLRFNYKMTDLEAALGRVQLGRLDELVRRRRRLARFYLRELADGPWELPPDREEHVYYRFVIRCRSAGRIVSECSRQGIEAARPVFRPLHRYLGQRGFSGAEEAHRRAVSIPLYPTLSRANAGRVVLALRRSRTRRS